MVVAESVAEGKTSCSPLDHSIPQSKWLQTLRQHESQEPSQISNFTGGLKQTLCRCPKNHRIHLILSVVWHRYKPEGISLLSCPGKTLATQIQILREVWNSTVFLSERKTLLSSCSFVPPCKGNCMLMCIYHPVWSLPSSRVRFYWIKRNAHEHLNANK